MLANLDRWKVRRVLLGALLGSMTASPALSFEVPRICTVKTAVIELGQSYYGAQCHSPRGKCICHVLACSTPPYYRNASCPGGGGKPH